MNPVYTFNWLGASNVINYHLVVQQNGVTIFDSVINVGFAGNSGMSPEIIILSGSSVHAAVSAINMNNNLEGPASVVDFVAADGTYPAAPMNFGFTMVRYQ